MTTAEAQAPRVAAAPAAPRLGFVGRLAIVEAALTGAEVILVIGPTLSLAAKSLRASGESLRVGTLLAALMIVGWVRAADLLRPLVAARNAKRAGVALRESEIAACDRAIRRAPIEVAGTRWLVWALAMGYLVARLGPGGFLAWPSTIGLGCIGILHAGGVAAARGALWERTLERARRLILPNFDALRGFAAGYRRRLCQTAWALLAAAHAFNAALIAVFTNMTSAQSGTLLALTVPALVLPMLLWYRSLLRHTRPIERYLDASVRRPPSRGPAREDPEAVAAFRAGQGLPYRLAAYQALACAFAVVAVVVVGRRLCGFDAATAGRLLGASALMLLAMALYETLLLRGVLRPLLGQLGARHRLPVAEIRAPITLRAKLVLFLTSVTVFTSGLVLLFALSPSHAPSKMLTSIALALGLALGLVYFIVRDMVTPIVALEERSDEMARGELARPVPPAGEADEIGRLSFAFEEMRRALRDKLRSTESLNIDLEREVRRRTEVLEQRNRELHDALEKLRRAQDDLIRSEKLASMGRLVAGIAHEINNPVNAVINTLGPLGEALQTLAAAPDGAAAAHAAAEAEEMLRVVRRGAARSKAIVQALHNYSRGDEQRPRELSIARSVDDTIDLLRHHLRHVRIEREIDPELRITGFPGQIDQVFMNLITNAAQAVGSREGGGTVRVAAAAGEGTVEITVSDDGPGIPPDIIARIFDPFFTTKDVGEGSGLGLSIVHGIVDRHGGRIAVESRVGEGTTFRVSLPARRAAAAAADPGT
ncbi:MAG TPA: ATP-binding protein [Polyangia bacterium]|nr:ATP-binding protein [Polyangia bacterium]